MPATLEHRYLTFHNEMAYLDTDKHLGKYGVFFVPQPSEIGGFTPLSDGRRVLARLKRAWGAGKFPTAMRWVLARKSKVPVPKKRTGGYLDFLLGACRAAMSNCSRCRVRCHLPVLAPDPLSLQADGDLFPFSGFASQDSNSIALTRV